MRWRRVDVAFVPPGKLPARTPPPFSWQRRIPGHGILALDAHLTPELRDEGMARDLVNHVQQIRKSLDLRYEQRIDLALVGDEDVGRVVTGFGDYIQGETLATNLLTRPIANIEPSKLEIDGHAVSAYVHAL